MSGNKTKWFRFTQVQMSFNFDQKFFTFNFRYLIYLNGTQNHSKLLINIVSNVMTQLSCLHMIRNKSKLNWFI